MCALIFGFGVSHVIQLTVVCVTRHSTDHTTSPFAFLCFFFIFIIEFSGDSHNGMQVSYSDISGRVFLCVLFEQGQMEKKFIGNVLWKRTKLNR